MAVDLNLIHTGLPWSSPQKIAIHSTQYINNNIINRGLLSLLNNDYYLQIKTQAINNFIEKNIAEHIYDEDLHVSWKRIKSLFSAANAASKDCIYFIPVYWNEKKMQMSVIENIFNMIPKNLNGHTIVLCLCTAYSKDYDSEKVADGYATYDLESYSMLLNGFIGGDLVLYSTRQVQILENYTSISSLEAKQKHAVNIFKRIQQCLDDTTAGFNAASGIAIEGNGLNKDYSVLSIKNCQASIYVVNMKIRNKLDWDNLATELENIKQLPSQDALLNFYSLIDIENAKILYKDLYLNHDFLYRNNNYALNFINGSYDDNVSSSIDETSSYLYLNKKQYLNSAVSPQYFTFDQEGSQMLISQQLRTYIYNWNKTTPQFTIAFFGECSNQLNNYTNGPIFSDYTESTVGDAGLYVYLNKLYRSSDNYQDVAQYNSDFEKQYANIINKWGLYVLQFIHDTDGLPIDSSVSAFNNTNLLNGNMRVNLLFYSMNGSVVNKSTLIPNNNTITNYNQQEADKKSAYLRNIGYQFKAPVESDFQGIKNSIKLFANKRIFNNTQSIKNWDYFSGNLRNIFLFNKILTEKEINAIVSLGQYNDSYHWLSESQNNILQNMTASNASIGAVYSLNNENLNFIKTDIITNG